MTVDGKALTRVCVIDFDGKGCIRPTCQATERDHRLSHPVSSQISIYGLSGLISNPSFSGITAAAIDPVTTTRADVQTHLLTLIKPSTILLGRSLELDLRALKLSHGRCIDTALLFHHPRGHPLKPGLACLTRKWLGRIIQDRGPGGTIPKRTLVHA